MKAERASHELELEREREAADARVAALKLRLLQTSQVRLGFQVLAKVLASGVFFVSVFEA